METKNRNKITIENHENPAGRETVVTIRQNLDYMKGQQFIRQFKSVASQTQRNWVINLTELESCNSKMLGLLIVLNAVGRQCGGSMVFMIQKSSPLLHKFQQSRLAEVCNIMHV
jgi:anti-anti-sigma regulatory factor